MIAIVQTSPGEWAVADVDLDALTWLWWCGVEDRWVSPASSYWHNRPSLREEHYTTAASAERAARKLRPDAFRVARRTAA